MSATKGGRRGAGGSEGAPNARGAAAESSAAPVAMPASRPPAADVARLQAGELGEPHALLGAHPGVVDGLAGITIRAWHPDAVRAECVLPNGAAVDMPREARGLFAVFLPGETLPFRYRLRYHFYEGGTWERDDPYRFLPTIGDVDVHLFNEGTHRRLWQKLGAHAREVDGVRGVAFAVWAPNARRVSVVGDFCGWDGRLLPMRRLGASGVWELFVPEIGPGALYKFELLTREGHPRVKTDPFALMMQQAPETASIVVPEGRYEWADESWMNARAKSDPACEPMAVYEVHLGSWARVPEDGGRPLSYREIAPRLAEHVKRLGFTHVEFLPLSEHPFYGSWGYQVTGFFAPTSRYGTPDEFRSLVDTLHQADIGVILDWVPAHFPKDDYALRRFDGTALYEHEDPRLGEHPDWGTLIFNYGRNEVRNYLLANALFWLDEFHIDGLRVDAVASMLYLDYSRAPGQWLRNRYGGRENLEAIDFLRAVNHAVRTEHPGAMTIAEESTAWPGVTKPVQEGGLGFTFKWNMGWMHDTLKYFSIDPVYRSYHHDQLTFAMMYEYSERFIMPLSHDEVVHLKASLLEKMPGDRWQKFANLRLLLAYMYTRPGKKLLFMGTELAPSGEWNHDQSLDWHLLGDPMRRAFDEFTASLGTLYREHSAFWRHDGDWTGFKWIDVGDRQNSVMSYIRCDGPRLAVVVLNLTPVPRERYRVGVPPATAYRVALSSDDARFGGSGYGAAERVEVQAVPFHGHAHSVELTLPPLGALVLLPEGADAAEAASSEAESSLAALGMTGDAGPAPVTSPETTPAPEAVSPRAAMSDGSPLTRLAEAVGILPEYVDQSGERRVTRDETRRALLAALGHDAPDDDAARAQLDALEAERRARLIEPVRVVFGAAAARVELFVDAHRGADVTWDAELRQEDGTAARADGTARVPDDGSLAVTLRDVPPLGYHTLRVTVRAGGHERTGEQRLIVTPARCPDPAALLRGQRVFGVTANLYTVRSARNWGVGDLTDLATLLELAADAGAAFVGVNPLHALRNADGDISPYSPVSRLYRNPIYLDVEAVAESARAGRTSARASSVDAALAEARESDALDALRGADLVDYEGVMALKLPALEALHRGFRARGGAKRRSDYAAWVAREGEALESFARFRALDEHFRARGAGWWREWPAEYQDARSPEVEAFAHDLAARVDFHRWLQYELDRQLAEAARRGRVAGMPIGLYQDLAIGTSPSGSDVWAQPELFVAGVSVGAPPDPLGPEGQNWGLPPIHPGALRADGYRYWSTLVRNAMRHSGALRLDHVLGLFRQFWIPEGMSGADGAYVKFPTEDLFGVLALEASRAGALVVGEDLGTVPPEVPPTLARWGVLSSKVLYFEREQGGEFKPTRRYPRGALATANTHDLAPLAGWWRGRDVALRREVGLLPDDQAHEDALGDRRRDRAALLALLVDEGLLDQEVLAGEPESVSELDVRAAAHALLRRSPSWLVGLSLDDLVGETEPVNVPGVGQDKFPCWRRRLSLPLERLADDPAVRRALGAERGWVP